MPQLVWHRVTLSIHDGLMRDTITWRISSLDKQIRLALTQLATGELSLGSNWDKLPECPKCGKHNLSARQGHTCYVLSCFRDCGFIATMETEALLASARATLERRVGLTRSDDDDRRIGRSKLYA